MKIDEKKSEYVASAQADVQDYWRNPDDTNASATYLKAGIGRSLFLVDCVKRHATPRSKIMELGCNAGRNLAFLWHAGFRNLSAVDINQAAVDNLRVSFKELRRVPVDVKPIEEAIMAVESDSLDVVFSVAVLEHLHWDSSQIFDEMARISRKIITIEDETTTSGRHFPRNYKDVFESVGMKQVDFGDVVPDLPKTFRFRAFSRDQQTAWEYRSQRSIKNPFNELRISEEPLCRAFDEKLLAVLSATFPKKVDLLPPSAVEVSQRSGASIDLVRVLHRGFLSAGWSSQIIDDRCYPVATDGTTNPRKPVKDFAKYISAKWSDSSS